MNAHTGTSVPPKGEAFSCRGQGELWFPSFLHDADGLALEKD